MADIANVAYFLAFFAFVVGGTLYLVWKGTESDVHSPSATTEEGAE